MASKIRRLPEFEDLFELEFDLLSAPDDRSWRAALVRGRRRRDREPVLVKYWSKTGTPIDKDLRELWARELRNAERIRVRPYAEEVLVPVLETGEARDAFFLVMPGEWVPLEARLAKCGAEHWLKNLQSRKHRQMLWLNVGRIVKGLSLIHEQRAVHGGLGPATIFTASDHEADFRVGGLEWCARIGEAAPGPRQLLACSFVGDFHRLGRIVAELLGIEGDALARAEVAARCQTLELSANEEALVLYLTTVPSGTQFERRRLYDLLSAVEAEIAVAGWKEGGRYILGVQAMSEALTTAIGKATEWMVRAEDRRGQLSFIEADLQGGRSIARTADGELWALGEVLAYRLGPGGPGGKPWTAAITRYAKRRETLPYGTESQALAADRLEVIAQADVEQRTAGLGARAGDWSKLVSARREATAGDDIRLGMLLTEVLLALYGAAEALPVVIVERKKGDVWLAPAEDETLDKLRAALKVTESLRRMQAIFELEDEDPEGEWVLRLSPTMGGRQDRAVTATFVETEVTEGRRYYRFKVVGALPVGDVAYLVRGSDRNPQGVVQRRLRLLSRLASQKELMQTLESPEATLSNGERGALEEDQEFQKLDDSKQAALRAIWRRTPLQAVVGPPGVGKTHLLGEWVRRSLDGDPSRRILISAQGHQALDNAGKAVRERLGAEATAEGGYLLVRSRSDRSSGNAALYASEHVAGFLRRVAGSRLLPKAPQDMQASVQKMLKAAEQGALQKTAYSDRPREVRAMESVVMQAANVLLATTNSSELARLVENGGSFDEVIVEEAAKATGPELLAPLLLGMQRLLIGDHRQLPAFDSDRLIELLGEVGRVKAALEDCEGLVGGAFRDHGLEELLGALEDADRLARVCERARGSVRLFETLVGADADRAKRFPKSERFAVELRLQRRMHPVICDVVSEAFYDGRLKTTDEAQTHFAAGPRPFVHTAAEMPGAPVVWVDLPYVQERSGAAEERPNYHNRAEREAVLAVLRQVRARPGEKGPSVAILSPYQKQAERLLQEIANHKKSTLAHLSAFSSPVSTGVLAGTVDSFQGSEADLVIVSLVRNNGEHGGRALGFLRDARRMNVLLSRARWQLVLVGSRRFFRAHSRGYGKGGGAGTDVGCIGVLMDIFDRMEAEQQPNSEAKFATVLAERLRGGRK
jgi:hypothetical protein